MYVFSHHNTNTKVAIADLKLKPIVVYVLQFLNNVNINKTKVLPPQS